MRVRGNVDLIIAIAIVMSGMGVYDYCYEYQ